MTDFKFPYFQDDLLRILGDKHRLYDFLGTLSVKISYLLFNKEHVKEILQEANAQKSTGNMQYCSSCMNILVVKTYCSYFSCFMPKEVTFKIYADRILSFIFCIFLGCSLYLRCFLCFLLHETAGSTTVSHLYMVFPASGGFLL